MRNRFVISESDRRSILSMYGLLTETVSDYSFSGRVSNEINEPIEYATLKILSSDNKLVNGGGTVSGSDGKYLISNVKMDDTNEYKMKITAADYKEVTLDKIDLTKKNQEINFKLETSITADLNEFETTSDYTLQGKIVKIQVLNENNSFYGSGVTVTLNTKNSKLKYFGITNEGNLIDTNKLLTDTFGSVYFLIYSHTEIKEGDETELNLNFKYNKITSNQTFNFIYKNPVQRVRAKKCHCFNEKGKNTNYIYFLDDGVVKSWQGGVVYGNLSKNIEKLSKVISEFATLKKKDQKNYEGKVCDKTVLVVDETKNYKDRLLSIIPNTFVLNETIEFKITVYDESTEKIVPNAVVKVCYDKQMKDKVLFQNADKNGVVNGNVELKKETDEGDETYKKRTIWVELREKGFDPYKKSFTVSNNNNEFEVYLENKPENEDKIESDEFSKKTNYFTFYGKTGKDSSIRYKSLDDAFIIASKDALRQYLEKTKYGQYKQYFEKEIPNGGEIVYKRGNETNGYYVIVKFSRKKLRKFVRSIIPKDVLKPEPEKKEGIIFSNINIVDALEDIKTSGKYITIFMFVDDVYIKRIINNYPSAVNELNKNSYNIKIDNTDSINYGTASNILNSGGKETIAVVAGRRDIRLKQSLYTDSDLDYVAKFINDISD